MTEKYQHTVPENAELTRIDKYLSGIYEKISRSRIAKLIDKELVEVNGEVPKASYQVAVGDEILLVVPQKKKPTAKPQNIPLDIVYEDDHVIVVNKSAGMVVHPAPGHHDGTLVNALTYHFDSLSSVQGKLRPGIIHRLDKNTTGLLMVAKDDYTHQYLSTQLAERTLSRGYKSIVWGNLKLPKQTIDAPIGRNPRNRQKMAVVEGGKHAKTHVEVIEALSFCDFVQCKLETGRTHQIRVHLSEIGHPVFGDPKYGGRNKHLKQIPEWHRKNAKRMLKLAERPMLHAYLIGFVHPYSKEYLEFSAPLPEDMEKVLSTLRKLI
jgi:23S rRNA pseudouridine1911/1915/1917 synthase